MALIHSLGYRTIKFAYSSGTEQSSGVFISYWTNKWLIHQVDVYRVPNLTLSYKNMTQSSDCLWHLTGNQIILLIGPKQTLYKKILTYFLATLIPYDWKNNILISLIAKRYLFPIVFLFVSLPCLPFVRPRFQ